MPLSDVEVNPPFPPMVMSRSTHVTYLDSIGRPAVTFAYDHLTEKHLGTIYVSYKVSAAAHFRKIGTVTGALMLVFVVAIGARRISFDLARSRAKKVM
jgi:oligosaccharyltransferase complex subunit alpha (ribophorin I)